MQPSKNKLQGLCFSRTLKVENHQERKEANNNIHCTAFPFPVPSNDKSKAISVVVGLTLHFALAGTEGDKIKLSLKSPRKPSEYSLTKFTPYLHTMFKVQYLSKK